MRSVCSTIVVLTACLLVAAAPAHANLLVNPNFAGSLSPWAGIGVYDAGNSHLADGSGSQLSSLDNTVGVNNSIGAGTSQCVSGITAGASYNFGGYASLEPPAPATQQGGAVINTQWFSDTACSTFITQTGTFGPTTQDTALNTYVRISHIQVAPAGAQSVLVVSSVLNNQPGPSTFSARFDDLFLQPAPVVAPPAPVPALGLPGLLAVAAFIAFGAMLALRRRRA